MANPFMVFVLTDGPKASKHRYYTTVNEAAKALAGGHGWQTSYERGAHGGYSHTAPQFGALTAMFMDRPGLDLTDFALAIIQPLEEEDRKRNHGIHYGGQRSTSTSTLTESEYQKLRSGIREKLKVELQLVLTNYLEKGIAP